MTLKLIDMQIKRVFSVMASILQLLLANEIPLYAAEIASSPPEELVTTLQKLFFSSSSINWTFKLEPGNIKGGSITVPLTSCLTGLD